MSFLHPSRFSRFPRFSRFASPLLASLPALSILLVGYDAGAQTPSAPSSDGWAYGDVSLPSAPPPEPGAPTDEPPRPPEPRSAAFGAKGQIVLGGGTNIGISSTTYDGSAASDLSAGFSPSIDYFVSKNFSIGLDLGLSYEDSKGYASDGSLLETKTTAFSVGPRFGLNVPLGSALSWWLTGSLGFESITATQGLVSAGSATSSAGPDTSREGPYVSLYLPLLAHPAPHFFMGLGPTLFHEFGALQGGPGPGEQRTEIGAGFVVGGYWGGTPEKASAPSETRSRPLKRFGEQGEFVFTNELVASVASTAYAGTPSSVVNGALTLGVDYFVANHFALGFGGSGSWSNSSGIDSSGNTVTESGTAFGFFIRTSAQVPLGGAFSLYPNVALGTGGGSYTNTSASGPTSYSTSTVWVTGYLPVVVELAPHFFAGFGPSVSHDLSNTYSLAQGQESIPGTTYGAGFVVGGWL